MKKAIYSLLTVIVILVISIIIIIVLLADKNRIKEPTVKVATSSNDADSNIEKELVVELNNEVLEYTGDALIPDFKVTLDQKLLETDQFKYECIDNIEIGTAKLIVKANGKTVEKEFKIVPKTVVISKEFLSTDTSVTIEWTKGQEGLNYTVYRAEGSSGDWTIAGQAEIDQNSFTDNNLFPLTTYRYYVVADAYKGGHVYSSPQSEEISTLTTPETPTDLIYYADVNMLSWKETKGVNKYEIYSIDDDKNNSLLGETEFTTYSPENTNCSGYMVRSYVYFNDAKVYSSFSDIVGIDGTLVSSDNTSRSNTAKNNDTSSSAAKENAAEKIGSVSHIINVNNILQRPELPTGCETTALTILLNYYGFSVDKLTLARQYLPKMDFYTENGINYGADFRNTFAGNPENEYSYGCYAPCIVTTANSYLSSVSAGAAAHDVSGNSFDSLLSTYIDKDIPVLIWITSDDLHETMLTSIWQTPAGETVQWVAYEHCVVLTGYDMENSLIYVSDPLVGNTSYDYARIRQRYVDMGQQCVYIG